MIIIQADLAIPGIIVNYYYLYNNPSYSRILIVSHLRCIGEHTHD